ncbi:MAG: hypothetical protein ISS79_05085 [Phycisphaerae bacterium]|nr:hypothetical protein [Phycisphaerae bacterium]
MRTKRSSASKPLLFSFLLLAGLMLLFVPQSFSDKCRLAFASAFQRPLAVGRDLSVLLYGHERSASVVSDSKYRRLRNFQANTALWLREERQKVEELSKLPGRTVWGGTSFVVADIITSTMNKTCGELLINRGKEDSLAEGQFVLGESSIIGTVHSVGSHVAKVKLITDPESKMPVSIANLDVKRVMKGSGGHSAKVCLLPTRYKIETGDIVWARKKPGFLNGSLIVGTVARCKSSDETPSIWEIIVKPSCSIERLNSVTVIVPGPERNS